MKKLTLMTNKLFPVLASLVMLVAIYGGVIPASVLFFYQPKVPKSLR